MKTITQHIRDHLLSQISYNPIGDKAESYDELLESQWSKEFIKLLKAPMVMGKFRYGLIKETKNVYDNIGSAIYRLKMFNKTGNEEYLRDAANMCMVEFMQKNHPNVHFESIDDGYHHKKKI